MSLLNAVRPIYYEDIFEYEDLLKVIDNALEGMEPEVISAYEYVFFHLYSPMSVFQMLRRLETNNC